MDKALIIDDESRAINLLKLTMEQNFPGKFLVETSQGGDDGIAKLNCFKPDLLFLDIEMPSLSGFDLIAASKNIDFKVIFTTAHNEYAIKAIRYNALDYLLKPIHPDELREAVERFERLKKESRNAYEKQLKNFIHNKEKSLAITTYDGVVFLELDNIIRCEADQNYTNFHLNDSKSFLSSKTLKEYEDLLDSHPNFVRVHRSHLVNINFVSKIRPDGTIVLKDGNEVPVSRRRKEEVLRKIRP